ncbi:MAG: nucleotide exchange factor GrpE, partial [Chloroflexales bacterium]|nr:nucleotide exchange factor GrpE [Chloroflexales bacterium]
ALDGIDAALRAGSEVIAYAGPEPEPEAGPSWLPAWLRSTPPAPAQNQDAEALREALDSWLVGLGFVRDRMLTALAEVGVAPIVAEGQPFDPRYHIAIEVVVADDLPSGTVAREIRRGYFAGSRVLRHAEVAVAGEQNEDR